MKKTVSSFAVRFLHYYLLLWNQNLIFVGRSSAMSKFKLVLFDKEGFLIYQLKHHYIYNIGGVRLIRESQKKRNSTSAEIFFVPFKRANICEFIPLKFYIEDKETPLSFHTLDTLETESSHTLERRVHILCVYGTPFPRCF